MCKNDDAVCSVVQESCRVVDTVYGPFVLTRALQFITVVVRQNCSDRVGAGLYCTVGYTSVVEVPGCADIDGIPIWLPRLGRYGCWARDSDLDLHLYPEDVTWEDIESNPGYYASFRGNALAGFVDIWEIGRSEIEKCFDFVPGNLMAVVDDLVQGEASRERVDRFIGVYEPVLLRYRLCVELIDAYDALVLIYKFRAQLCLSESSGDLRLIVAYEMIGWYKRCLPIIEQFQVYEMRANPLFSDVFLLLSFWCSDAGRFDEAFRYADQWLAYDDSVKDAYDELYRMLLIKEYLGAENFGQKVNGHHRI